ncbi:MAG: hypothetical protein R3D66_01925 [Alphaproteobacteria bacterium]
MKTDGKLEDAQKDTPEAKALRAQAYAQEEARQKRRRKIVEDTKKAFQDNGATENFAMEQIAKLAAETDDDAAFEKKAKELAERAANTDFETDPDALAMLAEAFHKDNNGAKRDSEQVALAVKNIARARQVHAALESEDLRQQYLLAAIETVKQQNETRKAVRDAQSTSLSEGFSAAGNIVSDGFNYVTDWGPDTPPFIRNLSTMIKGFANGGFGLLGTMFNNLTNGSVEHGKGILPQASGSSVGWRPSS